MKYGTEKTIKLAKRLGITTLVEDDDNPAMAVGGLTHGVTPLEMAGAYAASPTWGNSINHPHHQNPGPERQSAL